MRPVRFGIYTTAGCVPWIGGLAWAGYAAGASWQKVQHSVNTPAYIIAGLIGLLVIAAITAALVRRRRQARHRRPERPTGDVPKAAS
jgi:membrane protein DedA with SNARE-associated domain